jgi:hypothetical protein
MLPYQFLLIKNIKKPGRISKGTTLLIHSPGLFSRRVHPCDASMRFLSVQATAAAIRNPRKLLYEIAGSIYVMNTNTVKIKYQ